MSKFYDIVVHDSSKRSDSKKKLLYGNYERDILSPLIIYASNSNLPQQGDQPLPYSKKLVVNRYKRRIEYHLIHSYVSIILRTSSKLTYNATYMDRLLAEILTTVNLNSILYSLASELILNHIDNYPWITDAIQKDQIMIYRWLPVMRGTKTFDDVMKTQFDSGNVYLYDSVDSEEPLKKSINETCQSSMVTHKYLYAHIQEAYLNYTSTYKKYYLMKNNMTQYREYASERDKKSGRIYTLKTYIPIPSEDWNGLDDFISSLNVRKKIIKPADKHLEGYESFDSMEFNRAYALYEANETTDDSLSKIYGIMIYQGHKSHRIFGKHIWLDTICTHTRIQSKVKGMGMFMLNFLILQARHFGYDKLMLSVAVDSGKDDRTAEETHRFYRNRGFVPVSVLIEKDNNERTQGAYFVLKLDITSEILEGIVQSMYINNGLTTSKCAVDGEVSFYDILPSKQGIYKQTVVTPSNYFSRIVELLNIEYNDDIENEEEKKNEAV
jgi:GNAT superfamily N-acetyltransferase